MTSANQCAQAGPVRLEIDNGLATITWALPRPKNAFQAEEARVLGVRLEEAVAAGARCIVLHAEGAGTFCAGWDIGSIRPGQDDPAAMIEDVVAPLLHQLRYLAVPTMSVVRGAALGFGLGLALSCDLCLAEEGAFFGSPFRHIGMVPDSGTHFFLRERLGQALAAELVFTGRLVPGREAAQIGLVNRAVPEAALDETAAALAADIARGPTAALRLSKEILLAGGGFDTVLAHEARQLRAVFATADLREGIAAFQQRRKPEFSGR